MQKKIFRIEAVVFYWHPKFDSFGFPDNMKLDCNDDDITILVDDYGELIAEVMAHNEMEVKYKFVIVTANNHQVKRIHLNEIIQL